MSENKELKKGNGQEPETETAEEGVEGYYDTKRSVEENLKVYQKYLEGFLKDA